MFSKKDRKDTNKSDGVDQSYESLLSAVNAGDIFDSSVSDIDKQKAIKRALSQKNPFKVRSYR